MTTMAAVVPMIRTDEELVARSKTGDTESFNQLVKRWERPIFALAYRTLGREEDARDVTQETFLRAFRALAGFKGDAKFSSWLYRIALNLCRDWMRKERRAPVVAVPEGVEVEDLARRARSGRNRRRSRGACRAEPRSGQGHGAPARRAAAGDRPEGISWAHISGNRRSHAVPAQHCKNARVPGVVHVEEAARRADDSAP